MNTNAIYTEQMVRDTQAIGAPYTLAGEIMPLGKFQADMLADLIHGDSLDSVDHAPEGFTDCYEVWVEGEMHVLKPDGTLEEL
jgi:hypothetical protein